MDFANYDPKDIEVIVSGSILGGFAEAKVTVKRDADIATDEVGANGDVARAINNDKRGEITITLLQTSKSNLILSALAKADEFTGSRAIRKQPTIKASKIVCGLSAPTTCKC